MSEKKLGLGDLVEISTRYLLEAWLAMLIIGAIHSDVHGVPAIGYGTSLWLILLVNLLVGMATENALKGTRR
ncbi:hypothetical protein AB0D68_10970 [Streptomyces sp. NPDC048212]|uniref:hypothetical protein n=1 Tax=Streptomyces sp. NPDC048212 TaxID=3156658 RepID=UPI0033C3B800